MREELERHPGDTDLLAAIAEAEAELAREPRPSTE